MTEPDAIQQALDDPATQKAIVIEAILKMLQEPDGLKLIDNIERVSWLTKPVPEEILERLRALAEDVNEIEPIRQAAAEALRTCSE